MAETKKVKRTGRYGARYGVTIKQRILKIEEKQKQSHECPSCGSFKVKRQSVGIYNCFKCGLKFSGGAYTPVTMAGKIVKKMVQQKVFLPSASELISLKEKKQGFPEIEEVPETKSARKKAKKKQPKTSALPEEVVRSAMKESVEGVLPGK